MNDLYTMDEYRLGALHVRPRQRVVESKAAKVTLEPLVMQLLVALSRRAGQLVTREQIFETCWGGLSAGDDSLNRIVAVLRRNLAQLGGGEVTLETVPGVGYVLRFSPDAVSDFSSSSSDVPHLIRSAFDSWRLGLPRPDYLQIELLRRASRLYPEVDAVWGGLAALCRHAAEYAEPVEASSFLVECETAARRALALRPDQPEGLTALASIAPLFGRWADARSRLSSILERHPQYTVARHDLAVVEMATGRVSAAKALMDQLLGEDPLGACYHYKLIYQNWSLGNVTVMDHVGDRALQLWPTHPAIWTARLWSLAYTDRLAAAQGMLRPGAPIPELPAELLGFINRVLSAAREGSKRERGEAIIAARQIACKGPAPAIAALFGLGLLGEVDTLLSVAEAYYLRSGSGPVPLLAGKECASINDQNRRVTQILFTPVFQEARQDARFVALCQEMGLISFWKTTQLEPDTFLMPRSVFASSS